MSILARWVWKSLTREKRDFLLSLHDAHEQGAVNKILSNKSFFPPGYDTNKVIFIHVPKVAGSSLQDVLLGEKTGHLPLKYIESLGDKRYESYLKAGFVRNPWDRVFSAYNYLARGGEGSGRDGKWKEIIESYKDFNEFVAGWIDEKNIYKQIHFVPQKCFLENSAGQVTVDFIGRYESLYEDFESLKKRLNLKVDLPMKNVGKKVDYRALYSDSSIEKIARLYCQDIELFSYEFE